MRYHARIHRISAAGPNDVSGIDEAIAAGDLNPAGIVGIFGKTEGNGCVNDFTRGYAAQSLGLMLRHHLPEEEAGAVCLVMSGGTEGAMAPHWTVFERIAAESLSGPALAIGRAHTLNLPPEGLGRLTRMRMVADGVTRALADAGIENPADVHFVQIKCPLLTAPRIAEAQARGQTVATQDTLKSMGLSRAASALGVGVALGEIDPLALSDSDVGVRHHLWSGRASCSAGIELLGHEIIVLGMLSHWGRALAIDHAVMGDAVDIGPVRAQALARLGLQTWGGSEEARERSCPQSEAERMRFEDTSTAAVDPEAT